MAPLLDDAAIQGNHSSPREMLLCQTGNSRNLCHSDNCNTHKPPLFGAELIGRTVRLMLKHGRQQQGSPRWGSKLRVVGFSSGLHVLQENTNGKAEQVYLGPGLRFKIDQSSDEDLPANPSHDASLDSQSSVGRKLSVFWTGMGRWYRGEVVAYNEEEGTHTVVYADGETHEHVLRHESVKWTPLKGASPDEHCAEGDHSGNSHSVLAVPRAVLVPKPEDGQPSCNTSTAGAVQPATPVQLIESAKARPFHKTSQAAATSSEPSQQSTEGHRSGGIHCASAAAPHGVSAATVNRGVRPPSALLKVCLPPVSVKGEEASHALSVIGLPGVSLASPAGTATQDGFSGMRSYSSSPAPTTEAQQQGTITVARRTTKGAPAMRAVASTSCPAGLSMAEPGHSFQGVQLGGSTAPVVASPPAAAPVQQPALLSGASMGSVMPAHTAGPTCTQQHQSDSMPHVQVAALQCTNMPPPAPSSAVVLPSPAALAGASTAGVQQPQRLTSDNTPPPQLSLPSGPLQLATTEVQNSTAAGATCGQKRPASEPPLWDEEVEAREDVAPQHKAWNAAGAAAAAAARAAEASKRARRGSVPYSPAVGHAFVSAAPPRIASGAEHQLYQLRCRLQMLQAITARVAAAEIAEGAIKG